MALQRLREQNIAALSRSPELAMGVQLARTPGSEFVVPVIGAQVAVFGGDGLNEQLQTFFSQPWMTTRATDLRSEEVMLESFSIWLNELNEADEVEFYPADRASVAFEFIFDGIVGPLPAPPTPPVTPYGHVPFWATSGANDVYYRYEPFPVSRRVNQSAGTIAVGTFASPQSELPFLPTGFAAVARCALPSLFPARWRWEIQPSPGTSMRCGAGVPLYGQSGGGVEVMFPNGASNRGPIANPVVLPVL